MIEHDLQFFWAAAGFMAGVAVTILFMRLWRRSERIWAVGAATLLAAITFGIYYWVGGVDTLTAAGPVGEEVTHPIMGDAEAGSMQSAASKLAAKLAAGDGSDADWELLARTYEFMGDIEAAQLAKQHQLKPDAGAIDQGTAPGEDSLTTLQRYEQLLTVQPRNAAAWLAVAQLQRRARQFSAAQLAYEKVIELQAMDADAWADYADVRASLSSLSDAAVSRAIEAALRLNPQHPQALWLQASVAHDQRRHADAVTAWRRLRAVLSDDSPDAAVIDANLAEDLRLSGPALIQAGAAPTVALAPAAMAAQVHGTVEFDPKLKAQVSPGMILFIYAKAEDSPAPVAAYRGTVESWPVSFVLNDTHAMMPARKLSMYPQVKLEARLSRSGQATASAGDLQAEAITVPTRNGPRVVLKISRAL